MGMPYRARVNERTLLNLPGFHMGAYVYVYVEDTSERESSSDNFEPRTTLRIADCDRRIELQFEIDSDEGARTRCTSSTRWWRRCVSSREALVAEFEPYDRRGAGT